LWGKEVLISAPDPYTMEGFDNVEHLAVSQGDFYNRTDSAYYSYSLIQFVPAETSFSVARNGAVTVRFAVKNGYDAPLKFPAASPPYVGFAIWNKDEYKEIGYQLKLEEVIKKDSVDITIRMPAEKWGAFKSKIGISAPPNPLKTMTHNSPVMKLDVRP
jgi:hypothetical protein